MKRTIFYLLAMCCASSMMAVDDTYYSSLDGKSGATLFSTLTSITNQGYHSLGYDGLFTAYPSTDVYPADSTGKTGKIWDMYGGCDFSTGTSDRCGNYSGECDCFNREHSIPKSWWGGSTAGIGCDIFHVVPTDGKVNGMRSNYLFGEVASATYSYKGAKLGSAVSTIPNDKATICAAAGSNTTGYSGTVFEPIDDYKGDFARGYLGTIMKWNGSQTMTTSNGGSFFSGQYTAAGNYGLKPYAVALLMKWHRQDPVSQKEIDRNNGIQSTQGNRNPFIDYPYLAEYIWGEHAGEAVDMALLLGSFEADFIPGVSNGQAGGGTGKDSTVYTITFMNGGQVYETQSGMVRTAVTAPVAPAACQGNEFVGWTTQSTLADSTINPVEALPQRMPTGGATYYAVYSHSVGSGQTLSDNYKKITADSLLTSGNYVIAALNGNYYAMKDSVAALYYLAQKQIAAPINDVISSPSADIVWLVTVGTTATIYSAHAGKYVYAYTTSNGTKTFNDLGLTAGATDAGTTWNITYDATTQGWIMNSAELSGKQIEYYSSKSSWSLFTAQDKPVEFYKQQMQTGTAVYTLGCSAVTTRLACAEDMQLEGGMVRNLTGAELMVYDMQGRLVLSTSGDIALSDLPQGISLIHTAGQTLKVCRP